MHNTINEHRQEIKNETIVDPLFCPISTCSITCSFDALQSLALLFSVPLLFIYIMLLLCYFIFIFLLYYAFFYCFIYFVFII